MPVLAFVSAGSAPDSWREAFREAMPELEFVVWPDVERPEAVDYALCWKPPEEAVRSLTALEAVFSLGAGVDHLADFVPQWRDVPIVRMVEPALTAGMSEYVVYNVIRFHRRMPEYERMRARREWSELPQARAADRSVGIMGLGVLGSDAASKLLALGFPVRGWSRTPRAVEGVRTWHGPDGLLPFLEGTDILVCLLPLTPSTRDILDARVLGALPPGACLIHAGRGAQLVEEDLLAALEEGRLAEAAVDVCRQEPPPPGHPFWTHPRITLTPHVASLTDPRSAAREIARSIRRHQAGESLPHVVGAERGY